MSSATATAAVASLRRRFHEAQSKIDVLVDLTAFARGRACQFRVPGMCNANPETSVWCHVRRGGIAGAGLKPPDICGGIGCSACHDVIDGRVKWIGLEGDELIALDTIILEGVLRSQAMLWREVFG